MSAKLDEKPPSQPSSIYSPTGPVFPPETNPKDSLAPDSKNGVGLPPVAAPPSKKIPTPPSPQKLSEVISDTTGGGSGGQAKDDTTTATGGQAKDSAASTTGKALTIPSIDWKKCTEACLAWLKEKKHNPDIVMDPFFDVDETREAVEKFTPQFKEPMLFCLKTAKMVKPDELHGFTKPDAIVDYIYCTTIMVYGETKGTQFQSALLDAWNDVVKYALTQTRQNIKMASKVLKVVVETQSKKVGNMLGSLLGCSDDTVLCMKRGNVILSWVSGLKTHIWTYMRDIRKLNKESFMETILKKLNTEEAAENDKKVGVSAEWGAPTAKTSS